VKHRSIANQHGEVNLLCLYDDSTIMFTLMIPVDTSLGEV
jgi:hypothetical protein